MTVEQLKLFLLVFVRVGFIFIFLPFLGEGKAPRALKGLIVLALSLAIFPAGRTYLPAGSWQPLRFFMYAGAEALLGALMGVTSRIVFSSIRIAGELIGRQMGMGLARIADPITGVEATPIGNFCELLGVLVFFAIDGHHWMLLALRRSFDQWPLGAFLAPDFIKEVSVTAASHAFLVALQLAAPLILLTFLISLIMAVMARLMPEVNVLILGFPLRIGAGLIGLALFVPLLVQCSGDVSRAMLRFMTGVAAGS
ncbi:MAG: flagellar biosynthetic protein FliR [Candidatus Brocadiia bacterium]